jgi:hypothetical protein
MTDPESPVEVKSLIPGSIVSLLRRSIKARRNTPILRNGLRDGFRGVREGDRLLQMIGWSLVAVGVYQRWKRSQAPSRLFSAYLDMDESMGIRVLQKGRVVGEFPVGRAGG